VNSVLNFAGKISSGPITGGLSISVLSSIKLVGYPTNAQNVISTCSVMSNVE
jgi:hypothetical protein